MLMEHVMLNESSHAGWRASVSAMRPTTTTDASRVRHERLLTDSSSSEHPIRLDQVQPTPSVFQSFLGTRAMKSAHPSLRSDNTCDRSMRGRVGDRQACCARQSSISASSLPRGLGRERWTARRRAEAHPCCRKDHLEISSPPAKSESPNPGSLKVQILEV